MLEIPKKESVTYSIRCSPEERNQFKIDLKKIVDTNSNILDSSEALALAFKVYFSGTGSLSQQEAAKIAKEIIESFGCPWLKFDGEEYICLEKFHSKKKPYKLGSNSSSVIEKCTSCKEGKIFQEDEQTRKLLKGRTIKTFNQITTFMASIVKSGMPGTITFCNRLKPPVGTGMITIFCSKNDQRVDIDKICKDGPCSFLEQHHIKIHSEYAEKALQQITEIAEEYEQLEAPDPKKDVEVEQVEQEGL